MVDHSTIMEPPPNARVMSEEEVFSTFILPLNVAVLKNSSNETPGPSGTKSLSFSLDTDGRFLKFDPVSDQSLTITLKDGEVSKVHFTDRKNTQEDNVLYENEANALRSIHGFSKIDWADLKIYRDNDKGTNRFVNFLSRLRDTQDASRRIGMEAGIALLRVGILDTDRQNGIIDFADGKTGIVALTSIGDIRNSAIRDCDNVRLNKNSREALEKVKTRALISRQNSALVYFNTMNNTFHSEVDGGNLAGLQQVLLTFDDDGELFKLSFYDPKLSDEKLAKQSFTRGQIRALSLVDRYNAETKPKEFSVAYSNLGNTIDAPMVNELKQAVPEFFKRKVRK